MSNNISLSKIDTFNSQLEDKLRDINPNTNYQKSNYQHQTIQWLLSIYTYLFWIYIAVGIGLSGCIFLYTPFNNYTKIFFILLILLFPYYILKVEQYLYSVLSFIYSLLTSTIYTNVYYNQY
jgi:hypothetical protein